MLTTTINIIPENVIMSLTNDSDVFSSDIILQYSEMLLSLLDDDKAFTTVVNMSGFGKGDKGEPGVPEWGLITGNLYEQIDLKDALLTKEDVSNKVTTFTNASDTTYPTTKLVDTRFAAYDNISVVVDIVESYAALIAYDLQLKANAVIKVLVDETKDNKSTYYRWTRISGDIFEWVYVGDDPKTMIDDNIISVADVWSSSKTNDELNKLLPLIYAGL